MESVLSPKHSKRIIQSLEAKALKKRSLSVRFADTLTAFFGTFSFLILNIVIFVSWIMINTGLIQVIPPFDPYPFVLLTTSVSLEAIILTTIVMMSQNRQSTISALREELQLQVNFYSEREITKILKLLDLLLEKQGLKVQGDVELSEMLRDLDASYIEKKLYQQLNPKQQNPLETLTKPVEQIGKAVVETIPFKNK